MQRYGESVGMDIEDTQRYSEDTQRYASARPAAKPDFVYILPPQSPTVYLRVFTRIFEIEDTNFCFSNSTARPDLRTTPGNSVRDRVAHITMEMTPQSCDTCGVVRHLLSYDTRPLSHETCHMTPAVSQRHSVVQHLSCHTTAGSHDIWSVI